MDKKAAAAEVKRLRAQAKNEKIPQEARNEMLDKANEIEYKFYEESKGEAMAKGGAVKKKGYMYGGDVKKEMMAKGGDVKKKPAAKKTAAAKEMVKRSPVLAVMIGMTDKKKMAKGGYANCGASVKASGGKK